MNTRITAPLSGSAPFARAATVALSASVIAVLALTGCKKKEGGAAEAGKPNASGEAVHVVVSVAQSHPFDDWGTYSADLRGGEDATLTAPVQGGRVNQISEVGKAVAAGQALCDIESSKYAAMLAAARSQVEVAKGEQERQKVNVEKGFVGKAVLDQAELAFQQARVGMLQAQRTYEDSRCQAPFAGVLVSRLVERFQSVAPGTPTVRVAATNRLEAVVSIPESEARDFHDGQSAEFTLVQDTGRVFSGKLKSVDRAVEERNRTVMARIEVPNSGNTLRPGMVGRARILRRKLPNAVVIPSTAVLRMQEGTMVMLARQGKALEVPVKLGPMSGDSVVIESGVAAGDTLITTGGFQVATGSRITYDAPRQLAAGQ
jgi:membrane fusion protein (multidrug efflux system)